MENKLVSEVGYEQRRPWGEDSGLQGLGSRVS